MYLILQQTLYSRPQIQLSGTLGWHQKGMLNSSCASSRAAGMVEGSPDSSPSGRRQWDASRWANGLATVLTPIIISQTSLQHPTDSQTSQSSGLQTGRRRVRGLSQLCVANGINLRWTGSQESRGARYKDGWWWGTKTGCFRSYCYHDNQASILQQMDRKVFNFVNV